MLLSYYIAENIQTGDASAKSSVTTNVSGGNVYTHIESSANGETKILDTHEVGTHTVTVESSNAGSSATTIPTYTLPSPTIVASPTAEIKKETKEKIVVVKNKSFLQNIQQKIVDILHFLHFR